MISGQLWKLTDKNGLSKIEDTVFALLTKHGVEIQHEDILNRLAKSGCKVNKENKRVLFSEKLIRETLKKFGSKPQVTANIPSGWTPARHADSWGSFPHFLDWPSCKRRLATKDDVTNNIRMAHVLPEFKSIGKPMTCFEVDQRVEPIWNVVTVMSMTDKEVKSGEVIYPENIKHLVRLGEIYSGKPGDTRFVVTCDFCIAPLIFSQRTLECMIEKSRYGVEHAPGTMPISGLSGPVTVAGTASLALAELIAGWTIYYLLDPEIPASSIVATGSLDMRTMRPSFGSPEAVLQNMTAVHAAKHLYGINIHAAYSYVDCKTPGMQAIFEKMLPLLAFPFEGEVHFPTVGLLSAGQDYSPVQQLLEIDIKSAIDRVTATYEISEETLAFNLFESVLNKSSANFLDTEHTLKHFKTEQWYPQWFNRELWQTDEIEKNREQKMLEEIDAHWKNAASKYKVPDIDQKRLSEAKKVLKYAEEEKENISVK